MRFAKQRTGRERCEGVKDAVRTNLAGLVRRFGQQFQGGYLVLPSMVNRCRRGPVGEGMREGDDDVLMLLDISRAHLHSPLARAVFVTIDGKVCKLLKSNVRSERFGGRIRHKGA